MNLIGSFLFKKFLKQIKTDLIYLYSNKSVTSCAKKSTIYALSSGFGKCGVAVIRVSGPGVKKALHNLGGFRNLPDPRKICLRKICDPLTGEILDHGLVFWSPGPKSFTGEDCCEFQVHGGPAVVSSLLSALGKLDGFRPAQPGEFTRRAFYSGKLDLPAVEGLAALVQSETEVQRKHALYQMSGVLSSLYAEWAKTLLKCLAHFEAHIDFDEDQDIDVNVLDNICQDVNSLVSAIKLHLEDGRRGERIREGVDLTILGAPNSGKSSLLNILSRKPSAIVSSLPGTTRDVVCAHLDLNGYPINVSDTAGLRGEPADEIEAEGMSRALQAADRSDLLLLLMDISSFPQRHISRESFLQHLRNVVKELGVEQQLSRCLNLKDLLSIDGHDDSSIGFIVLNKIDLLSPEQTIDADLSKADSISIISCKNEKGIDEFVIKLTKHLEHLCGRSTTGFSRPYQRHCIEECLSHLENYLELASVAQADLSAEHLRSAVTSLGKITGRVSPEHLLDVIFTDFCIGKINLARPQRSSS